MKTFLHDVRVIARQELSDSIRSRRAAVMLLLFLAGAMLACNGFISIIHRLEIQLAQTLSLPAATTPGAAVDALWRSVKFREMVGALLHDRGIASELLTIHPMAILYGWLAFAFAPVLVVLTTTTRIADEVASGSVRFVMMRTSRQAWCLGKFAGQAMMLIVALLLSAVGAWSIARYRLFGMDGLSVARGMILYAWKAWIFSLAFVGLSLGLSQVTRSPNKAMALGFAAWAILTALGITAQHFAGDGKWVWTLVQMLIPMGHRSDLWRLDLAHQLQAGIFLVSLGLTYLAAGHLVFGRKDL